MGDKRTRIPHIRFTEQEYEKLKNDFDKTSFSSFSAYIRFLIQSKKVDIVFSPSEDEKTRVMGERNKCMADLNRQILMIGNNINQVAKKVNSQQYVMREDLNSIFENLKAIQNKIDTF